MSIKMSINSTATPGEDEIEILPWNNPSNILSFQAYQGTVHYYNVVMKPVVVVAGVATNIINCLVFRRQGLKDRMNLCLFVLALIDIVYLLYCMIFTVAYWVKILHPVLGEEFYQKTFCYAGGVCSGLRETSTSISVLIAVERCVCVVFPLRANSFMSTRTMGILLAAIVMGIQLAFIMTPLKRYVFPVYDNTTGMTMWKTVRSAAWQDNEALFLYDTVDDTIMLVAFPFVMFILVSGATAITVVKLRAALLWRQQISCSSREGQVQQVALTRMLVLASCVFIASKVPVIAFTVASLVDLEFSPFGKQYNVFKIVHLLVFYFPYAHCAVSFFVYYSLSSRFKSELRDLCGCSLLTSGPSCEVSVDYTVDSKVLKISSSEQSKNVSVISQKNQKHYDSSFGMTSGQLYLNNSGTP